MPIGTVSCSAQVRNTINYLLLLFIPYVYMYIAILSDIFAESINHCKRRRTLTNQEL